MAKKKKTSGLTRIRQKPYDGPLDKAKVTAMRERRGLTKSETARRLGWKAQKWWDFESGRNPDPRVNTITAVCAVLGCKVDDLLRKR